jgi:RNase P/RNase MRP subunit p29
MRTIKDFIIEYTQKPLPCGLDIVEQSVPICFFGNIETAKVATIGINPAPDAFEKKSPLPNRVNFNTTDNNFLSIENATHVYNAMLTYFNRPYKTYHRFFKRLETFVAPVFNCHYLDGTMVHLDIVPWATNKKWTEIPKSIKKVFIEEYKGLFVRIINENDIKIFFVNGKAVKNQLQEVLKLDWEDKKIKTGKNNTTVSIAQKNGKTFLASSRFTSNDHLKKHDREQIQQTMREFLGHLIENRPEGNMDNTKDMIISRIDEKIIIIKTKEEVVSERGNLYEATRKWWRMKEDRAVKAEYIFAVVREKGEIVQEVYKPEEWHYEDYKGKPRLVFEGVVAPKEIRAKYIGKQIPSYYCWKPGLLTSFFYTYE